MWCDVPSGVSDYGSATWLGALFGVVPLPDTYYLALCGDEPGTAMDGTMLSGLEPDDPGYGRIPYNTGAEFWDSNGPYLTNTQLIEFPPPEDDWGYLTHFALCTAQGDGQVYAWGELFNPQFVTTGIGMMLPPGALVLGLHALDNTIAA